MGTVMAPKKAPEQQLEKTLEKEMKKSQKLQETLDQKDAEIKLMQTTDSDRAFTIQTLEKDLKGEKAKFAELEANFKNVAEETRLLRQALAEAQAQLPKPPKRARESPSTTALVPRPQDELSVVYTSEHGGEDTASGEDPAAAALQALVQLRRQSHLCDAVIVNQSGCRFIVHRALLAAGSPKLREYLTSRPSGESSSAPIEVNFGAASEEAVAVVVNWMYGQVTPALYRPTTDKTNEDVLQLASELGLPRLAEACARQLAAGVTVSNIVGRMKLCEEFGLPVLRSALFSAIIQDKRALAAISQDSRTLGHPALMRELLAAVATRASEAEEPVKRAKGGA